MSNKKLIEYFSKPLLHWFQMHGRKDLPWQHPRTAYRVWISEIMLQQTQVLTVIPYFLNFMQHFPTIKELAQAQDDDVLALWSGLGYYSRARNLHKSAQIIQDRYQGVFPEDLHLLMELPGIGQSTAAAILAQAFNKPEAILDGNVKRVLSRFFRVAGYPEQADVKKSLWELAYSCMPSEQCAAYTQAIMDLGATCCKIKNPNCTACPVKSHCQAFQHQEQHVYPYKKIKKTPPLKYQQFLVMQLESNLIYLEKRPPTGLWGGLWCFPYINQEDNPLDFIEQEYAFKGKHAELLTSFRHKFSHFHLEINALHIKVCLAEYQVKEPRGQWFTQEQLPSLGLAKPTSLILNLLKNST